MGERAWIGREERSAAPPRALCLLLADRPAPAAIVAVNARLVTLETFARPDLGSIATLRHPRAGTITGVVTGHDATGIRLALAADEPAVAFALAVIADRMMNP